MNEYRAGGHDWLAIWRDMFDAERAQGDAATPPDWVVGDDFWQTHAARLDAQARAAQMPDPFAEWLLPRLRPDDTVLDVGAGSGRYVPVLAAAVGTVLALEPSAAMQHFLRTRIAEVDRANVQVVADGWPAAQPISADVVISAHVVYAVRDVGPFLLAMDAAATRLCCLALYVEHPSLFVTPFWELEHGVLRLPLPAALECFAAATQLGLPAQFALLPAADTGGYADEDSALEDIRFRLRVTPDAARDTRLRTQLRAVARQVEGRLIVRPRAPVAVIWWERGA